MKGHRPINVKAYWVFLGPHFIPIRTVFYSFCTLNGIRNKKEVVPGCLDDIKYMEKKLEEFRVMLKNKGDKKSVSEINSISEFIEVLYEYFEKSGVQEKLNLKNPTLKEDSKYIQAIENISRTLKVA